MRINRKFQQRSIMALAAGLVAWAIPAHAAVSTWNQTTSGNWQDATPWSGSAWSDGNDAVFNEANAITVTLTAPVSANSVTWTTGKVTVAGTSPNALSIGSGGITVSITPPATAISAPVFLTASQNWVNTSGTAFVVSGKTDFGTSAQTLSLLGNNAAASVNFKFSTGSNTGSGTVAVGGVGSTAVTLQVANTANKPFGNGTLSLRTNGRISSDSATAARTITNPISLDANSNVGGQSNVGALTFSGGLNVSGNFTMTSDCGTVGSGANHSQTVTFTGPTTLGGNLTIATSSATNSTTTVINSNTTIFKGAIGDDGTPRNLVKTSNSGTGDLGLVQLDALNTYTGSTTVTKGTLQLDGGSLENSNISIAAGATFNATSNFGTLNYNLVNDTSDLITDNGTLDITNLDLNVNLSGTQTKSEYVLASLNPGSTLLGSAFAATNLPQGWTLNYSGTQANPNSIVLLAPVSVPEPASLGLLVVSAASCLTRRQRKNA